MAPQLKNVRRLISGLSRGTHAAGRPSVTHPPSPFQALPASPSRPPHRPSSPCRFLPLSYSSRCPSFQERHVSHCSDHETTADAASAVSLSLIPGEKLLSPPCLWLRICDPCVASLHSITSYFLLILFFLFETVKS